MSLRCDSLSVRTRVSRGWPINCHAFVCDSPSGDSKNLYIQQMLVKEDAPAGGACYLGKCYHFNAGYTTSMTVSSPFFLGD